MNGERNYIRRGGTGGPASKSYSVEGMASKSPITCHGTRVPPSHTPSRTNGDLTVFHFSLGGRKNPSVPTFLRPGHARTVLDSSIGKPAQGVKVQLLAQSVTTVQPTTDHVAVVPDDSTAPPPPALTPTHAGVWVGIGTSVTNSDGRCLDLFLPSESPTPSHALRPGGTYQIVFETEEYFKRTGRKSFYPFVQVRTGSTCFLEDGRVAALLLTGFNTSVLSL